MKRSVWIALCLAAGLRAQEAESGFEVRGTVSEQAVFAQALEDAPRDGFPAAAGFRAVLYPTWKLNQHWSVDGAIQTYSRPYFFEQFSTQGYGLKTDVLRAELSYSQFWKKASVVIRAGQMPTAFGSFLLRYDDAENYLIDMPLAYGYYGAGVSALGLAGAQVDATLGRLDLRAQFVNSSPANRRSIFDREQYGNWAGGAGYTIRQGLRVGVSGYRGPYLDRQFEYYFPGEADPRDLPATAYGADVQWGRGHLNVNGEWQHFTMAYHKIPTFREHTGYAEARYVVGPRWYLAARGGYLSSGALGAREVYEVAAGFRPNRYQLVKVGYELGQGGKIRAMHAPTLVVQFVTTFRAVSLARD